MALKNVNLPMLIEQFHDEDACRRALEDIRWPDGITCLRCGSKSTTPVKNRPTHVCNACAYQFSVMVGTVLQDTKIPLWKWFLATFMICESRKGVSSNQLKRMLGVTYKSAWFLSHRIRFAMAIATPVPLEGVVEVDETFMGGKPRYSRYDEQGRKVKGVNPDRPKTVIMGAIQRGGDVRIRMVANRSAGELQTFIRTEVADAADAIHTDDYIGYNELGDADTKHHTVNHRAKEYVRGEVHTNSIESVWSLFKRSLIGSYHQLSTKHLDAYLDELEWRYNNRDNPYLFRDTLAALLSAESLEYKNLIA